MKKIIASFRSYMKYPDTASDKVVTFQFSIYVLLILIIGILGGAIVKAVQDKVN